VYRRNEDPPWEARRRGGARRPRIEDATEWARDPAWLHEVAKTPERDLRGHRIALTYHALAIDLYRWIYDVKGVIEQDDIVGQVPRVNANWFNFATWATATLNADIRNDDPPYRSDRLVPPGFYRRLTPTVLAIKSANRQRYNQLLTWYQRMVFINTAFTYSAMRRSQSVRSKPFAWIDPNTNAIHVSGENPNDADEPDDPPQWMIDAQLLVKPPGGPPALERPRHLKPVAMAMEYYRRARAITLLLNRLDPAQERLQKKPRETQQYFEQLRARLVFFGNLIITSVEQDVVNPGVERVLNNVPVAAGDYLSNHIARIAQRSFGVPRQLAGLRIPAKLQPAEEAFQQTWARLLTRELLVLALPAETLRLGRDIPPLTAGEPFFPTELYDLTSLPELLVPRCGDEPVERDRAERNRQVRNLIDKELEKQDLVAQKLVENERAEQQRAEQARAEWKRTAREEIAQELRDDKCLEVAQANQHLFERLLEQELRAQGLGEEEAPKEEPPEKCGDDPPPYDPDCFDGYVFDFEQHRIDNTDLFRTVCAFDRSQGDGIGTGARDWRKLAERLNWATTLIRTRIQDASLFWPPFRNEDVERIYRGKLPLHSGNPTDFDVLGPLESFPYLCGRDDVLDAGA
jgi:hypothetical protein